MRKKELFIMKQAGWLRLIFLGILFVISGSCRSRAYLPEPQFCGVDLPKYERVHQEMFLLEDTLPITVDRTGEVRVCASVLSSRYLGGVIRKWERDNGRLPVILIGADTNTPFMEIMKIMAICRNAGVGLVKFAVRGGQARIGSIDVRTATVGQRDGSQRDMPESEPQHMKEPIVIDVLKDGYFFEAKQCDCKLLRSEIQRIHKDDEALNAVVLIASNTAVLYRQVIDALDVVHEAGCRTILIKEKSE